MDYQERKLRFPAVVCVAAQHTEKVYGVPACVTLAQWALESAYGSHSPGNNPFGHKGNYRGEFVSFLTHEVLKGRFVKVVDNFCRYPDLETAFKEHGRKLRFGKPYQSCVNLLGDWQAYIEKMGRIYATDPAYARKLRKIIEDWRLYEFNLPKEVK